MFLLKEKQELRNRMRYFAKKYILRSFQDSSKEFQSLETTFKYFNGLSLEQEDSREWKVLSPPLRWNMLRAKGGTRSWLNLTQLDNKRLRTTHPTSMIFVVKFKKLGCSKLVSKFHRRIQFFQKHQPSFNFT